MYQKKKNSKMQDIVSVLLTSEGCGHCHSLRGVGKLGDGKQFNSYKFFVPTSFSR